MPIDAENHVFKVEKMIHRSWKANPVKVDPFWHQYIHRGRPVDNTHPIVDWMDWLFYDDFIKLTTEPPPGSHHACLAQCFARFSWNV
jgi:hypothetical protein